MPANLVFLGKCSLFVQFIGGREVDYILLCDVPCDGQRLMAAAGASVSSDVEEF